METPDQNPKPLNESEGSQESRRPAEMTSLCARIWEYPNPQQKLRDLDWSVDDAVAEALRHIMSEGRGRISQLNGNTLIAEFDNVFNALSAAKALQVRLLTLQRSPGAAQIVTAIILHGSGVHPGTTERPTINESNSAQILVSERIYESARTVLGFQFSPKAARAASSGSEAFYELLWTDESTYSHVRKTGQASSAVPATTNRYQILSELGRGAMGIVYKAQDQLIGRPVALKTISVKGNFAEGEELVERLRLEAKAAGGLDHPNIVTIYDIGQQDGFVYLSMQFVEGKTLADVIEHGQFPPLATLFSYADQMCSAIGYAHQHGVIHRDIKPANFMLSGDGTIKIMDFGIAKLGDASVTQTGVVVGTPTYMAPEQATGKKLDQRSDIFALGSVLYELFTRERAFKGDVPTALYKVVHEEPIAPSIINPALPPGFDGVIRKALAKDPKDRYQTCEELKDALNAEAALLKPPADAQNVPVSAPPRPPTAQTRPASSGHYLLTEVEKRRRKPSIGVGIAAIFVIAGVTVEIWAFRVKAQTGALPPQVSKVVVGVQKKVAVATQSVEARVKSDQPATSAASAPAVEPPNAANNSETADTQTEPTARNNSAEAAPSTASDDTVDAKPAAANPRHAAPPRAERPPLLSDKTSVPRPVPTGVAAPKTEEQHLPASSETRTAAEVATPPAPKDSVDEANVDGFTRAEIPDLLRKADESVGAGDYAQARYAFGIVLRLDHKNEAARNGLANVTPPKPESLQR